MELRAGDIVPGDHGADPPAIVAFDQHDAAVMTPAANPIMASIRRRGTDRTSSTGRVPIAVSTYVPVVATSA